MTVDALNFEFLLIVNTWQSLLVLKLQQSLALNSVVQISKGIIATSFANFAEF